MFAFLVGNAMWHLIKQSDAMSFFVLLVLFFMSVACWAVFLCKIILVRLKKRDLRRVLGKFKQVRTVEDMLALASEYAGTVPGYFLSKNLVFLKSLLETGKKKDYHNWELMQHHMEQTLDEMVAHEESYLPVLSTSAAVAPLLGLFGTIGKPPRLNLLSRLLCRLVPLLLPCLKAWQVEPSICTSMVWGRMVECTVSMSPVPLVCATKMARTPLLMSSILAPMLCQTIT